jgi:transposase
MKPREPKPTYEELVQLNSALLKENQELKEENMSFRGQLAWLKRRVFGHTSERYHPEDQLSLFSAELATATPEAPVIEEEQVGDTQQSSGASAGKRNKKAHPGRNPIPEHLPRKEVVLQPEGDITGLVKIGEEVKEVVQRTPGSIIVVRYIRPKYAKPEEDGSTSVLIAPAPPQIIEKSYAGASLLAYIICSKFLDHIPFYRMIAQLKREYDWIIDKSTINDWFVACCTMLEPVYKHLLTELADCDYIQADETKLRVQSRHSLDAQGKRVKPDETTKSGKCHIGWLWELHSPERNIVIFQYDKGRGTQGAESALENFHQGYLQADGLGSYNSVAARPGVQRVGCLAHARRKFFDAKDNDPKRAEYALKVFQAIYAHERRTGEFTPEQRKAYRLEHIEPLLSQLKNWADEQSPYTPPKSAMGQAFTYLHLQWPRLIAVLLDGRLKLDNNLAENKIRPIAIGRKNYLFAGSHQGAERIAMIYSLLGTCIARKVEPLAWLTNTLEKLPVTNINQIHTLLPGYVPAQKPEMPVPANNA